MALAEVDLDDSELYLPPPQLVITNKSHGMVELTADCKFQSSVKGLGYILQ